MLDLMYYVSMCQVVFPMAHEHFTKHNRHVIYFVWKQDMRGGSWVNSEPLIPMQPPGIRTYDGNQRE